MIDISNEIRGVIEEYANLYRQALKSSGHVASGQLADFTLEIEQDGKYFNIFFLLQDYWKYLENGRRAGKMPPIDAILRWIQVKPIIPRTTTGKVPNTRQLAFLIARGIAKNGTPATHLLSKTYESLQSDEIIERLTDLILEQIEEEVNKEIEDEIS